MNHHYKSLLGLLGGEIRQSLAWPGKPCRLEHHKNIITTMHQQQQIVTACIWISPQ